MENNKNLPGCANVLILAITTTIAIACDNTKKVPPDGVHPDGVELTYNGKVVQTVVHDSCEYVVVDGVQAVSITHKQNCKNPIHHDR